MHPTQATSASSGLTAESQNSQKSGIDEVSASRDDLETRMRIDFNFMAALAMPLVFKYLWPAVYLAAFKLISDKLSLVRDFSKIAFGFPRGFAKTTFVKLVVLWIILFTNRRFILIIGSNEEKAAEILSDVCDMLDEPNIQAIFGNWRRVIEKDTGTKKKFSFRGRDIILVAVGKGGSVRGIVSKHARPDVMIFDDIQEREEADSEVEYNKLKSWFFGTAIKAASPEGCLYMFLANMYPTPFSLLGKLRHLSSWTKFITGAITIDGKSLWEDLQPIRQLLREYQEDKDAGEEAAFLAEKMNDENATSSRYFDSDKIVIRAQNPDDYPQGKFVMIDPAGAKKKSDDNIIGYFEVYDGMPIYTGVVHGKFSPREVIEKSLELAWKNGCRLICVESTAYQASLLFWFEEFCRERRIEGFFFMPVARHGISKNADILNSFKSLMNGEWGMTRDVRDLYVSQAVGFDPLKTNNRDDLIDVPCFAPKIMAEYPNLLMTDYMLSQEMSYSRMPVLANSII